MHNSAAVVRRCLGVGDVVNVVNLLCMPCWCPRYGLYIHLAKQRVKRPQRRSIGRPVMSGVCQQRTFSAQSLLPPALHTPQSLRVGLNQRSVGFPYVPFELHLSSLRNLQGIRSQPCALSGNTSSFPFLGSYAPPVPQVANIVQIP